MVEHGGGGSAVAAPVARDILLYALAGGLPPLSAYPSGERAKVEEMWSKMNLMPTPAPAAGTERAKA